MDIEFTEFTNGDGAGVRINYAKAAEFARQSRQAGMKRIDRKFNRQSQHGQQHIEPAVLSAPAARCLATLN